MMESFVETLLKHGADPTKQDYEKAIALEYCAKAKVQRLLAPLYIPVIEDCGITEVTFTQPRLHFPSLIQLAAIAVVKADQGEDNPAPHSWKKFVSFYLFPRRLPPHHLVGGQASPSRARSEGLELSEDSMRVLS